MNCAENKTDLQDIIAAAQGQFDELITFAAQSSSEKPLHEMERNIFRQLLALGQTLLRIFLVAVGAGDVGAVHTDKSGIVRRRKGVQSRAYCSIFGKIQIKRCRYWERGTDSVFPLDAVIKLPRNCYSYLLQEWGMLIGAQEAWSKVTSFLKEMFQIDLWSSSLERIASDTVEDVEEFYDEQRPPAVTEEGELLVVTLDGKGVPIKKGEPTKKKVRRKKGEKPGKKKMATVTAAYTIDRHERGVDDIVKEPTRDDLSDEHPSVDDRPIPQNKIVKATLEGKELAVKDLAEQVRKRDPEDHKEGVALMDGEPKLRALIATYLPSFCIIIVADSRFQLEIPRTPAGDG